MYIKWYIVLFLQYSKITYYEVSVKNNLELLSVVSFYRTVD